MSNAATTVLLSRMADRLHLTDGGLETTMIFHEGLDLPHFAAFTLLERAEGLLPRALQDAEVDAGELARALQPRGEHSESRNPVFATELVQWLQDALLVASLELGQSQIDEAALILALLRNPMRYAGSHYQPLLAKLNAERLRESIAELNAGGGIEKDLIREG